MAAGCVETPDYLTRVQTWPARTLREVLEEEPSLSTMREVFALAGVDLDHPPSIVFVPDDCALAILSVDLRDPARAKAFAERLIAEPAQPGWGLTGGDITFADGRTVTVWAPRFGHDPGFSYCVPSVGAFDNFEPTLMVTDTSAVLLRDLRSLTATCGG